MEGYDEAKFSSKDKVLVFHPDGSCSGFHYPGGKRLFYTEGNSSLFVFVYGTGLKLSNWTYQTYYKVEGNRLYLWGVQADMLAGDYTVATTYTKE